MPASQVYGEFMDALWRIKCPFCISKPRWENSAESHFRVIWLECKLMLPSRVSRLLSETGFLSVSQLLRDLK